LFPCNEKQMTYAKSREEEVEEGDEDVDEEG
jgi:hypothetical protein